MTFYQEIVLACYSIIKGTSDYYYFISSWSVKFLKIQNGCGQPCLLVEWHIATHRRWKSIKYKLSEWRKPNVKRVTENKKLAFQWIYNLFEWWFLDVWFHTIITWAWEIVQMEGLNLTFFIDDFLVMSSKQDYWDVKVMVAGRNVAAFDPSGNSSSNGSSVNCKQKDCKMIMIMITIMTMKEKCFQSFR